MHDVGRTEAAQVPRLARQSGAALYAAAAVGRRPDAQRHARTAQHRRFHCVNTLARDGVLQLHFYSGMSPRPIRVLLLGKENVGKTTVARLLRNAKAKVERSVATDGVEERTATRGVVGVGIHVVWCCCFGSFRYRRSRRRSVRLNCASTILAVKNCW